LPFFTLFAWLWIENTNYNAFEKRLWSSLLLSLLCMEGMNAMLLWYIGFCFAIETHTYFLREKRKYERGNSYLGV
jgi:hypothetical protein